MDFSMRIVNALFKKEVKDLSKNTNVLFLCIIPIIFCFMYSKTFCDSEEDKLYILNLCVNMNLTVVTGSIIAMMIAEEKEKNTLRTLMLACVSPLEFLMGKVITILLLSIGINGLMFFIIGIELSHLGYFILITTLVVISMMEFGAVVGIVARDQMSTGTIGMPFFMAILMIPYLSRVNDTCKIISKFLPNYNMEVVLNRIFTNESISINFTYNIIIILIWIVTGAGVFAYAYSKKKLD